MKGRPLVIALAVVAVLAIVWVGVSRWMRSGDVSFQGYVEGEFVYVAPEIGGQIVKLAVDEGTTVKAGDILYSVDSSILEAQRRQAAADLGQAEAKLADLLAAQRRPEEVAVTVAQKARAKAQLDLSRTELDRQKTLFQKGYASQAVLDQAEAAFERDKAALAEVERQISAYELSSRSDAIDAARAATESAKAALGQIDVRIGKLTLRAPADALVHDVYFRPGEVVNVGQPVLALLPPENRILRFYVSETKIATLKPGDRVAVSCDSCPPGLTTRVSFISQSVEFTPPVIFSEKERAKLVFRVEAKPFATALPVGLPVSVHPLNGSASEAH